MIYELKKLDIAYEVTGNREEPITCDGKGITKISNQYQDRVDVAGALES